MSAITALGNQTPFPLTCLRKAPEELERWIAEWREIGVLKAQGPGDKNIKSSEEGMIVPRTSYIDWGQELFVLACDVTVW